MQPRVHAWAFPIRNDRAFGQCPISCQKCTYYNDHLLVFLEHLHAKELVYTIDHEVVPRACKICDWLLKLVPGPLRFTPRNECQGDHGVRGPLRDIV